MTNTITPPRHCWLRWKRHRVVWRVGLRLFETKWCRDCGRPLGIWTFRHMRAVRRG